MKQEVRRGRKFVEYHDPETQDEFTFTQEISGADVSYQDEAGNWLAADENWATDGVDGFVLKNDKLNHKVRMKGNGRRNWYPRRNVNTEYMTFGVPQYWNGKRWANFSFSGWSVEGKTITLQTRQGVTILVHNRWDGIKIDWVLASSAAPSRMRYPVSLTGITYVDGIIYGADGTRLGQLTPTTATDSTFDEDGMPTQLPCSGSYSGGYVEFQADVTGAVYPVTIDPDFSAGASEDTTLRDTYPTRSYGASNVLSLTRNLIRFDISSIDSGNTVTAVSLFLCKTTAAGGNSAQNTNFYSVSQANGDWVAGTTATPATSGQATYGYKKCYNNAELDVLWAGSDGLLTAVTDYENTILGNIAGNRADELGTQYESVFNSNGITRVQGWTGSTNTNYGLVFNPCTLLNFASSDHTTEAYRPKLTVTYTAAGGFHPINMTANMQSLTGGMRG
jgi:hypothetical protein